MNKKTKLLSIFILAGVISTGVAVGATGCKKHTHNWSDEYTVQENGKHAKTCDGCSELLDEHDGEWTNDADTTCDHDGCDVTRTVTTNPPAATDYEVDAAVTALKITGVTAETINLNSTDKTSHTIDKSAIKVYFMKGSTQGDEVPAANLSLTLLDGSNKPVTSWENITTGGTYKINAKLTGAKMATGATVDIDDVIDTVTITIVNNVTGLALKDGATLEQKMSAVDSMTSTWNFQSVYQNGDKTDLTAADVEIGKVDTLNVGDDKTVTVTLKGTSITTTVTYSIKENPDIHIVSTGYIFGDSDVGAVTAGTEYKQGDNTVFTIKATGSSVTASAAEYNDGTVTKKFYNRYTFGGGSFSNTSYSPNSNNRYWDVTTTGAGTITVYFASGGGDIAAANAEFWGESQRGIAVFSGEWGAYNTMTLLGKKLVPNDSQVYALTVAVEEAGTYHIATANSGDMRLYGVQVDTMVEEPGDNVGLPTATVVKEIKLTINDTEEGGETKKTLKVGQPFSNFINWIDSGKKVNWNPVSGDVTETDGTPEELATATYKIKGIDITGDDTITADMLGTNVEITITIGGVSTTHKVTVETEIPGVTGITAGLTDAAKARLEVETAEDKFTLTKEDIAVAVVQEEGTGAIVDVASIMVLYDNDSISNDGQEFAPGTYTITVRATVSKDSVTTSVLETTFQIEVTVKPEEGALTASSIVFNGMTEGATTGTETAAAEVTLPAGNIAGSTVTGGKIVSANGNSAINIEKGSFKLSDTETVTECVNLNGNSTNDRANPTDLTARWIELTLAAAGTYNITVWARGGSLYSGNGLTNEARTVAVYSPNATEPEVKQSEGLPTDSSIVERSINNVECGTTLKIGSNYNGIRIYKIVITPVAGSGTTNPGTTDPGTGDSNPGDEVLTETAISFDSLNTTGADIDVNEDTSLTVLSGNCVSSATVLSSGDKPKIKAKAGTTVTTGVTVDTCFSTQGGGSTSTRKLKVELVAGATYTITIYAKSGSSSGEGRHCSIWCGADGSDKKVATDETPLSGNPEAFTFENIAADTIYIGGDAGIDIYYIVITPNVAS